MTDQKTNKDRAAVRTCKTAVSFLMFCCGADTGYAPSAAQLCRHAAFVSTGEGDDESAGQFGALSELFEKTPDALSRFSDEKRLELIQTLFTAAGVVSSGDEQREAAFDRGLEMTHGVMPKSAWAGKRIDMLPAHVADAFRDPADRALHLADACSSEDASILMQWLLMPVLTSSNLAEVESSEYFEEAMEFCGALLSFETDPPKDKEEAYAFAAAVRFVCGKAAQELRTLGREEFERVRKEAGVQVAMVTPFIRLYNSVPEARGAILNFASALKANFTTSGMSRSE